MDAIGSAIMAPAKMRPQSVPWTEIVAKAGSAMTALAKTLGLSAYPTEIVVAAKCAIGDSARGHRARACSLETIFDISKG